MVRSLVDALAFLASAPTGPGDGGFGTEDMSRWLWGLRHQVKFESILASYVTDPTLSLITDMFSITTERVPLAPNLPAGDPRRGLKWFPRGGDQWSVDAANPGIGGGDFRYGAGPAMRLVFKLKDGQVEGGFVLPGGQSGLTSSPYFDDMARLWLANEYLPVRFAPRDVAAGAIGREVYLPAP
jgi:acyl-homoserine lactone acylase PvdQ